MKKLDTREYLDTVSELLQQGHAGVPVPVTGGSMVPFLHPGDTVYLDPPAAPKRGDVVLYTRPGGQYVLHRILRVQKDGALLLAGDAQREQERLPGTEFLRGTVSAVLHRGKRLTPKHLRWCFFASIWMVLRPVRPWLMKLAQMVRK